MCGIAGVINFDNRPVSPIILRKMADVTFHRGPDDQGDYIAGNVGLTHRRLSIIDLSPRGHQPMSNEDKTIWIVYNGEIYNYKSLNKDLIARGHQIRSNCDTETILHLYEEYGTRCVDYLRGMFSFAIWDLRKKKLFAAVDRMRIKPLYYTVTGNSFVFASELKAILASGLYQPSLNKEAVHHYLSLQAVPVPLTIYENVYTLQGGYFLEVRDSKVSFQKYSDISFDIDRDHSEEYFKKRLKDLLYESVELRLMSDVPLGAFLSGGIDSTVVVSLMKEMRNEQIKTFSIGYNIGGRNYDDTYYAKLVARRLNTDHTVQIVTAKDILKELKNFIWYLDQPSTDAINSYFVSRLASRDVTVALCGQGGDELFAGYQTFNLLPRFIRREQRWDKLPSLLRKNLTSFYSLIPDNFKQSRTAKSIDRFFHWYGSFIKKYGTIRMEITEEEKFQLYSDSFKKTLGDVDSHNIYRRYYDYLDEGVDPVNKVSYLDLKTHLGDVLMRDVDVMSMAFSLETRIPLIDHKLVEFVATIPPEFKLRGNKNKYIFLESVKELLPEEVIKRPKQGFAFPFNIWLRSQLRPLVEFVLSREHIEERGFFKYSAIEFIKQEFYSDITRNYRRVWGFIILELWLRLVWENDHRFFDDLLKTVGKNL